MSKIDKYALVELESFPDFNEQKLGDFLFSKEFQCVRFHCPCGCGIQVYLRVSDNPNKQKEDRVWRFDASTCTLSPSIQQIGHCQSHYHIENAATRW